MHSTTFSLQNNYVHVLLSSVVWFGSVSRFTAVRCFFNSFHATHIQAEYVYKHIAPSIKPYIYSIAGLWMQWTHLCVSGWLSVKFLLTLTVMSLSSTNNVAYKVLLVVFVIMKLYTRVVHHCHCHDNITCLLRVGKVAIVMASSPVDSTVQNFSGIICTLVGPTAAARPSTLDRSRREVFFPVSHMKVSLQLCKDKCRQAKWKQC